MWQQKIMNHIELLLPKGKVAYHMVNCKMMLLAMEMQKKLFELY